MSAPMTPERLIKIRNRFDWTKSATGNRDWYWVEAPPSVQKDATLVCGCVKFGPSLDEYLEFNTYAALGLFLVHAQTDVPDLIAEVERLQDELGDAKAWGAHFEGKAGYFEIERDKQLQRAEKAEAAIARVQAVLCDGDCGDECTCEYVAINKIDAALAEPQEGTK